MSTGADAAVVSILVDAPRQLAFDVFTRETDAWWRTGPRFRMAGKRRGKIWFEPRLGGKLFESFDGASGPRTFEIGEVTTWSPPEALAFTWRATNFAADEATLVEITFEPSGPEGERTRLTVRHSGFARLRPDHPVRHGEPPGPFLRRQGMWWSALLVSLREHLGARPDAPGLVTFLTEG